MTIRTRLKKLEDRLDVNREKTITLIITHPTPYCNEPALCFLEPVKEWLTCRDAVEEGRRTGRPVMLIPDPLAEFEVRHGLQPGTLTEHPQRQTISFSELLALAGGEELLNTPAAGRQRMESYESGLLDGNHGG